MDVARSSLVLEGGAKNILKKKLVQKKIYRLLEMKCDLSVGSKLLFSNAITCMDLRITIVVASLTSKLYNDSPL